MTQNVGCESSKSFEIPNIDFGTNFERVMDCAPLEFNEINLQTSCWPPKNMIHCLQTQDDLWDQKLGQVPFEQLGSFEFQSSQLLSFWNGNATYLIAGLPFAVSFSSQVHLVWH